MFFMGSPIPGTLPRREPSRRSGRTRGTGLSYAEPSYDMPDTEEGSEDGDGGSRRGPDREDAEESLEVTRRRRRSIARLLPMSATQHL